MMLDRVNSCYQKNKNHPAILIWSTGNESYGGSVLQAMCDKFHELDQIVLFITKVLPGMNDIRRRQQICIVRCIRLLKGLEV